MDELSKVEKMLDDAPNVSKLLRSAEIAVDNQTKLAEAAMIAAKALDKIATAVSKYYLGE